MERSKSPYLTGNEEYKWYTRNSLSRQTIPFTFHESHRDYRRVKICENEMIDITVSTIMRSITPEKTARLTAEHAAQEAPPTEKS